MLAFTENWLNEEIKSQEVRHEDFNIYRCDRNIFTKFLKVNLLHCILIRMKF